MSFSDNKDHFQFVIYTQTGNNLALKAVEYGLIRLRRGAPFSKTYRTRTTFKFERRSPQATRQWYKLRVVSLRYRIIARNAIEVHLVTNRQVSFAHIAGMVRAEIRGPFITGIKEDIPMVWF